MYYLEEKGYLELLKNVKENGEYRQTRNGYVYSTFSSIIKFNIKESFPLLTTKKMFSRGIIEELLWMIKGSVNSKELEEKGVNIWKSNSSREYLDSIGLNHYEEGYLGPIYGYQWRNFNGEGFDQIAYVLKELLKHDNSRRAIISAWNPAQIKDQALPPCHILYNFYQNSFGLSCMMTMRSTDLFLGLPFNIASTALLTTIIAKVLHMNTNEICVSMCDAHIYEEHLNNINIQISRDTYDFPSIKINKTAPELNSSIEEKIKWIEELKYEDFELINYNSYKDTLKAIMK